MAHRINDIKDVALVIKVRRRELGDSQEQFARRIHKTQPYVSEIERGRLPHMSVANLLEILSLAGIVLEAAIPSPANVHVSSSKDDGDLALYFPDG